MRTQVHNRAKKKRVQKGAKEGFRKKIANNQVPKGPYRTKNTTVLNSVVFYYCRSFLLSVAICCLLSFKNSGLKVSAVVFYYRRSEFTLRSKFTIRSIFSTGGSFGFETTRLQGRQLRRMFLSGPKKTPKHKDFTKKSHARIHLF